MKRKLAISLASVVATALSVGASGDRSVRDMAREIGRDLAAVSPDVQAQAAQENFNALGIMNTAGQPVVGMAPDSVGDGVIVVANRTGLTAGARVGIAVSASDAGLIILADATGRDRYMISGDGGLRSLAADMAEEFTAVSAAITAGTVVVIDPDNKGALRPSQTAYDRRVAGVVAGANDYRPGITLGALTGLPNRVPVTLSGTAYCRVTGSVRAGDLLTTSAVAGHAMRAPDTQAAQGAILGKAMEDFDGESGLILILASLQ